MYGCCNTLDDLHCRICVLNKTKNVNLNVFDMITRINKSKALTKHKSYDCKCKYDGIKSIIIKRKPQKCNK